MHISKSISWIEPYLEDAKKLVPEIRLVTSVIARSPKPTAKEIQRIHAIIHANLNGTFKIVIMVRTKRIKKIKPLEFCVSDASKIDILGHLAHELAHLRYWDHTPHRMVLECKLQIMFMRRLAKDGYISEEVEFNRSLNTKMDIIAK